MNKLQFLIFCFLITMNAQSQLTGDLKFYSGQKLKLTGYNNFKSEELSVTTVDSLGMFTLIYPNTYKGIAVLKAKDKSSLAFILTEQGISIKGKNLKDKDKLSFVNSKENAVFVQYFKDYKKKHSVLSAWYYLKDKYLKDSSFKNQKIVLENINTEILSLEQEDINYLKSLDKKTYVSWFLPLRKFVSDMTTISRYYTKKIPQTIAKFRSIDFNNQNFKTSGLLKQIIDGHYLLLENVRQSKDSMYTQMNKSTDYLINNLLDNKELLNTTSDYLFSYLERRSLHESAAYLAVKLLSEDGCNLNDELTNKLESYRKLKLGNIAPDIVFSNGKKLSDIPATKLLVFGASWCLKCKEDLPLLQKYYTTWKEKNIEIIYISIDTDKNTFENFYKDITWKTDCTFKGWDTQAVKDYHVFATPTYFLLDKNLKILLRPNSITQTNNWINSMN